MMKITFDEANVFKEIINILDSLINEGKFVFDGKTLKLRAIDAANVCLIDLEFSKDSFLEAEGKGEFIVKIEELKNSLKKAKKTDVITLELDEEKHRLKVILKGTFKRSFAIPLISEEVSEIPEASLEDFTTLIEIDSKVFKEAVETVETVSETSAFIVDEEKFIIKAEEDLEEASVEFDKLNEAIIKFEVKENSKALYSNDYLKKIIKTYKISPTVIIQFANSYPLKIEYNNLDKNKISFIIAPKIE